MGERHQERRLRPRWTDSWRLRSTRTVMGTGTGLGTRVCIDACRGCRTWAGRPSSSETESGSVFTVVGSERVATNRMCVVIRFEGSVVFNPATQEKPHLLNRMFRLVQIPPGPCPKNEWPEATRRVSGVACNPTLLCGNLYPERQTRVANAPDSSCRER